MIAAVTTRITQEKKYYEVRDSISHDLSFNLNMQDIIPIPITNTNIDPESLHNLIPFDFLILSGGDDYIIKKKKTLNKKDKSLVLRDYTEKKLVEFCIRKKIPIIGICRGMQFLNFLFNGTEKEDKNKNHVNNNHLITSEKKFSFFPEKNFWVNSYHSKIINEKSLGENLIPIAQCNDGTIEAFMHKHHLILSIMWHPERVFSSKKNDEFFKKKFFLYAFHFLVKR